MRKPSRFVHRNIGLPATGNDLSHFQLRDLWDAEISKEDEPARINIMKGLSKMTLDAIGLAGKYIYPPFSFPVGSRSLCVGFNYHFDSLNTEGKPNELNSAFETMFGSIADFALFPLLQAYFPPLRIIVRIHRAFLSHI